MSALSALAGAVRTQLSRARNRLHDSLLKAGLAFERIPAIEGRYLRTRGGGIATQAAEQQALRPDHPRLVELRRAYAALPAAVTGHSRWTERRVRDGITLPTFRGDSYYLWQYRERPRLTEMKYFVFLEHVRRHDPLQLLERLTEDGAFGCWTFDFGAHGRVSRDLLESVLEINYLHRQARIAEMRPLRVLDVGAGYGRLAHRMSQALDNLGDYCCVDAVPESTFLSEYYLNFRGCAPPARVVPLHEFHGRVAPGSFDVALNIHSFSECTHDAVAWWAAEIERLRIPWLLVVPNEPGEFLTLEQDGARRDFRPLLEQAGYRLVHREPVIDDSVVRRLAGVPDDHFHLFRRDA